MTREEKTSPLLSSLRSCLLSSLLSSPLASLLLSPPLLSDLFSLLLSSPLSSAARSFCRKSQRRSATSSTDPPQLPTAQRHQRRPVATLPSPIPTAQRHRTQLARHVGRQSQPPSVLHGPQRRPSSQPPAAFRATHRHVPRQLRQPASAFCETSAPSSHPQIHRFPAPAMISRRLTHPRTRALPISRTRPRNPTVSADSLRLPRKMMPSDVPGHTIPHTCHAKRTRSNVEMHESPRLPRERSIHTHVATRGGTR